jgi:hypothetical protein
MDNLGQGRFTYIPRRGERLISSTSACAILRLPGRAVWILQLYVSCSFRTDLADRVDKPALARRVNNLASQKIVQMNRAKAK